MFFKKTVAVLLALLFAVSPEMTYAAAGAGASVFPLPGTMLTRTQAFTPVILKGMVVHPEDPLQFDFVMDTGSARLSGEDLQAEAKRSIKDFLSALTVPEDDMWVNLSPYERDRIIPEGLGKTEMGRDVLAQDYVLKQLASSLLYPEGALGREFWARVYAETSARFDSADINMDDLSRVWIAPGQARVWEHDGKVMIIGSHLKVMLESDHGASANDATKQIMREVLIPALEKEVNEGAHFARLRQVYAAMILSAWYKVRLKETLLGAVYADRNRVAGIGFSDQIGKEEIYNSYLETVRKGVFNYIKEEKVPQTGEISVKKYFAGGFTGKELKSLLISGLLIGALSGQPLDAQAHAREASAFAGSSVMVSATFGIVDSDIRQEERTVEKQVRRIMDQLRGRDGVFSGVDELLKMRSFFDMTDTLWHATDPTDDLVFVQAAEEIGILGTSAMTVFINYLDDPERIVQLAAVIGLVSAGDPGSVEPLKKAAKNTSDASVRGAAVMGVLLLEGEQAVPFAMEILRDPNTSLLTKSMILSGLSRFGGRPAVEAMLALLRDRNDDMAVIGILGIGLKGADAVEPVLGVYDGLDKRGRAMAVLALVEVRYSGVRALERQEGSEIVDALIEMLSSTNDDLRSMALLRLSGMRDGRIKEKVELLREDPSPRVRGLVKGLLSDGKVSDQAQTSMGARDILGVPGVNWVAGQILKYGSVGMKLRAIRFFEGQEDRRRALVRLRAVFDGDEENPEVLKAARQAAEHLSENDVYGRGWLMQMGLSSKDLEMFIWTIELLIRKSGKGAILPLMTLLRNKEVDFRQAVRSALKRLTEDDPELKYKVGEQVLSSKRMDNEVWAIELLATLPAERVRGLLEAKRDVTKNPYVFRTALIALKKIGAIDAAQGYVGRFFKGVIDKVILEQRAYRALESRDPGQKMKGIAYFVDRKISGAVDAVASVLGDESDDVRVSARWALAELTSGDRKERLRMALRALALPEASGNLEWALKVLVDLYDPGIIGLVAGRLELPGEEYREIVRQALVKLTFNRAISREAVGTIAKNSAYADNKRWGARLTEASPTDLLLSISDKAQAGDLGGIDLNASKLDLQIRRDGKGIPLPLNRKDWGWLDIQGITPVINRIEPVSSLFLLNEGV